MIHSLHHVAARIGRGNVLAMFPQPALREHNLVILRDDDAFAQHAHRGARAVGRRPSGHLDGLRMMADHAGHEMHVCRCVVLLGGGR
jgi:hypothetical protein